MITAIDGCPFSSSTTDSARPRSPPERPGLRGSQRGPLQGEDGTTYLAKSRYNYDEAGHADRHRDRHGLRPTARSARSSLGNQLDRAGASSSASTTAAAVHARRSGGSFAQKALVWSFIFAHQPRSSRPSRSASSSASSSDKHQGSQDLPVPRSYPYAFPAFLATLVWKGMLNRTTASSTGCSLGGAHVPWLTDGTLAKLSILGVNLWLQKLPYMFLCLPGCPLQSLPGDVEGREDRWCFRTAYRVVHQAAPRAAVHRPLLMRPSRSTSNERKNYIIYSLC